MQVYAWSRRHFLASTIACLARMFLTFLEKSILRPRLISMGQASLGKRPRDDQFTAPHLFSLDFGNTSRMIIPRLTFQTFLRHLRRKKFFFVLLETTIFPIGKTTNSDQLKSLKPLSMESWAKLTTWSLEDTRLSKSQPVPLPSFLGLYALLFLFPFVPLFRSSRFPLLTRALRSILRSFGARTEIRMKGAPFSRAT